MADEAQRARRVAIFVEPSPFSHVSGMKNRFLRLIEDLSTTGDDVLVITPDRNPPEEYSGARVMKVTGVRLPFYSTPTLLLSLGVSPRVAKEFMERTPDVIHASSPGLLVFGAIFWARMFKIPLVISYHTHIPQYIPQYTWSGLVKPMWDIIRWCSHRANMTLVTSDVMAHELRGQGCRKLSIWERGVDTKVFHPHYRAESMRNRMREGRDGPIIGYVGRLGPEKNLDKLKMWLEQLPNINLCLIGDGPSRKDLEHAFVNTRTTFMGMLQGEELSSAFASLDVFVMPSESETLGFVVMEAMASQVPVVAVAAGGLTDIIQRPGETGLLYQPGNYSEGIEHTRCLVEDESYRQQIARQGREEVEKYAWSASNSKLRNMQYTHAMKRFKRIERIYNALKAIQLRRWIARTVNWVFNSQHIIHIATVCLCIAVLVGGSQASANELIPQSLSEVGFRWLESVKNAGNAGPLFMLGTIALGEMVPLVPTQPFAIASGLLFGWITGALVAVGGSMTAAIVAFTISRTQGFDRVQSVLAGELGQRGNRGIRVQLRRIQDAVGEGGALQQTFKIALLRLTPIVPYSISNYLLGLTGIPVLAFVAGTLVGLAPWMVFYAFVGNTGRALLQNGLSLQSVVGTLTNEITSSSTVSYVEIASIVAFAVFLIVRAFRETLKEGSEEEE